MNFAESLVGAGALQPLKPIIFRPDALEDSKWRDGFAAGSVSSAPRKAGVYCGGVTR